MKKRLIAIILNLCLLLSPVQALAATPEPPVSEEAPATAPELPVSEEALAHALKGLGLFHGVNSYDFALNRAPTRVEALVMLLRLLGKEQEALDANLSHPFLDTEDISWADPYIGYAYANGLTQGQSKTRFGGKRTADAKTYLTFVLRALGYTEGADGDFTWDQPFSLAQQLGLTPDSVQPDAFRRADMVTISYAALGIKYKDSDATLAQTLVERGTLNQNSLDDWYDAAALARGGFVQPLADRLSGAMDAMEQARAAAEQARIAAEQARIAAEQARLAAEQARIAQGITLSGSKTYHSNGTVIQIGDAAYENYSFYAYGASRVAAQIRKAAEVLEGKANVYGIVVPNALGALLSLKDFSRVCSSSKNEIEAIDYAYAQMGSLVRTPDAIRQLRLHNDEYIYFRTDHHWTALGAYYAYVAWAKSAGVKPVPLNNFSTLEMPGHFGMFYGMCGSPSIMRNNPDTVVAYIPPDIDSIQVEFQETYGTRSGQLVYDYRKTGYRYGAFIGGDHPLTTITNNNIRDNSACVLVKDSYGNPFSIYLTQHYHTVYVIDYRYYKSIYGYLDFSRFAAERGVSDFIILLPMTLSQADATANLLSHYCK